MFQDFIQLLVWVFIRAFTKHTANHLVKHTRLGCSRYISNRATLKFASNYKCAAQFQCHRAHITKQTDSNSIIIINNNNNNDHYE